MHQLCRVCAHLRQKTLRLGSDGAVPLCSNILFIITASISMLWVFGGCCYWSQQWLFKFAPSKHTKNEGVPEIERSKTLMVESISQLVVDYPVTHLKWTITTYLILKKESIISCDISKRTFYMHTYSTSETCHSYYTSQLSVWKMGDWIIVEGCVSYNCIMMQRNSSRVYFFISRG